MGNKYKQFSKAKENYWKDAKSTAKCAKKVTYYTLKGAKKAEERVPHDVRAYHCPICQKWHLGGKDGS